MSESFICPNKPVTTSADPEKKNVDTVAVTAHTIQIREVWDVARSEGVSARWSEDDEDCDCE